MTVLPHARVILTAAGLIGALWPLHAAALPTLPLPGGATAVHQTAPRNHDAAVATGPFDGRAVPLRRVEGSVADTVWQAPDTASSVLDLIAPLRDALIAQGYAVRFECADKDCGGFDFRYAIPVVPEPDMHVDLGDFRYLAADRGTGDAREDVALLVSRSSARAFIQLTTITPRAAAPPSSPAEAVSPAAGAPTEAPDRPAGTADPATDPATASPGSPADPAFAAAIDANGSVALDDLAFATGDATLAAGRFASLDAVAAYLAAHPDRRITLVGHTDASGALDANVALSKRRAQAVADRLVADYGVARAQVSAEGAGFLAPRATNLTEQGRQKNRRVEAMLASTR